MFKRIFLSAFVVSSFNVSAITLDDFSTQLVESHPYFVQLSLSEKTSLINQKSHFSEVLMKFRKKELKKNYLCKCVNISWMTSFSFF